MKESLKERAKLFGEYIVNTKSTIRQTASYFGVSKSTVHNDISKKLIKFNKKLYAEVKKILDANFLEKHIRGGDSTKNKYFIRNI